MKKVKVGIIGTGYTIGIAKSHVKAFEANDRTELKALYDIVPGRAAAWAQKNSVEGAAICESLEELFGRVDAVSICTPNNTHVDLIVKALEAGKHVICEKPYTTTVEEGKRAVEAAKRHPELVVLVSFNYREQPVYKYIKHIVDAGKIGKVYTCRQELGGGRIASPTQVKLEWRMQEALSGTGALADFGCHMLDLADYILSGSSGKICEVQAMTNTFIPERTVIGEERMGTVTNDDCAVFNARMEKGTLLSFVAGRLGVPQRMLEIVGEGGMLAMYGKNDALQVWYKDSQEAFLAPKWETVKIPDEFMREDGHMGLINRFVEAVLDGKPDDRGLDRGLYIQYLLDMLKKSAKEGKTIKV